MAGFIPMDELKLGKPKHKITHIGSCDPNSEIKMQSVSSGGWGTKSYYIDVCQECGAKSEAYTLS